MPSKIEKSKEVSSTPTASMSHGAGGLFSMPGMSGTLITTAPLIPNAKKKKKIKKEKTISTLDVTGKESFTVYKDKDSGKYRWVLYSSNAFRDSDKEIVSEKALANDVDRADQDGDYGPLRWWHVKGADIGDTDFNMLHGKILIESGTFRNDKVGAKFKGLAPNVQASIGFNHPATEPDDEGVFDNIRRFERSLLPRGYASNGLTALAVKGVSMATKEEKLKALHDLLGEDADEVIRDAEKTEKSAIDAGIAFKEATDKPDDQTHKAKKADKPVPPADDDEADEDATEEAAETPEEEASEEADETEKPIKAKKAKGSKLPPPEEEESDEEDSEDEEETEPGKDAECKDEEDAECKDEEEAESKSKKAKKPVTPPADEEDESEDESESEDEDESDEEEAESKSKKSAKATTLKKFQKKTPVVNPQMEEEAQEDESGDTGDEEDDDDEEETESKETGFEPLDPAKTSNPVLATSLLEFTGNFLNKEYKEMAEKAKAKAEKATQNIHVHLHGVPTGAGGDGAAAPADDGGDKSAKPPKAKAKPAPADDGGDGSDEESQPGDEENDQSEAGSEVIGNMSMDEFSDLLADALATALQPYLRNIKETKDRIVEVEKELKAFKEHQTTVSTKEVDKRFMAIEKSVKEALRKVRELEGDVPAAAKPYIASQADDTVLEDERLKEFESKQPTPDPFQNFMNEFIVGGGNR